MDGSELGYLGGGDCARDIISSSSFDACSFSSLSSRTDDGPSLAASSVPDNVMAECSESLFGSSGLYPSHKGAKGCDCRANCMNILVVVD